MEHLMVDIETLGTSPKAVILSIGAVFFDITTGELGPRIHIHIDPNQDGREIDSSTVMWWMKQSEEARKSIDSGSLLNIQKALSSLRTFLEEHTLAGSLQVWGNGATFDPVILADAYDNDPPWKFWNVRDQRTMVFLDQGRTPRIQPELAHDALSDAIAQAKYVSAIWKNLNVK